MTVLPILERELRVRARSPAHHWGRFAVGALGLLIGLPPLVWSGPFTATTAIGRGVFDGLVSGAFLLCCAACLLTADTISGERREGTLGLLLLTRVRHFDMLLGKLASSGLTAVLGLAAFLPVLMLPLLAGGVTGGEAARKGLALFDTLWLSLGTGLWASARGYERFRTARAAVLVVAGIVLGPLVLGFAYRDLRLVSPLAAIFQAADSTYRLSASRYWLSLGLVQLIAWALLLGAIACLRSRLLGGHEIQRSSPGRTGRELAAGGASVSGVAEGVSAPLEGSSAARRCAYCGRQNEGSAICCSGCGTELLPRGTPGPLRAPPFTASTAPTPLDWLLRRRGGLRPMLWLAAALGSLPFLLFGIGGRFLGMGAWVFSGISWAFSFAVLAVTGSIFAWVASRFFVEARRTGELELLVTTPLGAESIISAQWKTLKGLVAGPTLLMLAPIGLHGLFVIAEGYPRLEREFWLYLASLMVSALNMVLRVGALCWIGLWFGLRAGTQARAILWTLMLVEAPPYVLSLGWSLLYRGLVTATGGSRPWPWVLGSLIPQVASPLFMLWLIGLARRQLRKEVAGAEPLSLRQVLGDAWHWLAAGVHEARHWPPVRRSM